MIKHLAYPTTVIEQIGSYLMTRPYAEVHQLIAALQSQGVQVEIKPQEESIDGE